MTGAVFMKLGRAPTTKGIFEPIECDTFRYPRRRKPLTTSCLKREAG